MANPEPYTGDLAALATSGQLVSPMRRQFDVILSDVVMPVAAADSAKYPGLESGHIAAIKIRLLEQRNHCLPAAIVGLSANAMNADRDKSAAAGMGLFLAKPFSKRDVLTIVVSVVDKLYPQLGIRNTPSAASAHDSPGLLLRKVSTSFNSIATTQMQTPMQLSQSLHQRQQSSQPRSQSPVQPPANLQIATHSTQDTPFQIAQQARLVKLQQLNAAQYQAAANQATMARSNSQPASGGLYVSSASESTSATTSTEAPSIDQSPAEDANSQLQIASHNTLTASAKESLSLSVAQPIVRASSSPQNEPETVSKQ